MPPTDTTTEPRERGATPCERGAAPRERDAAPCERGAAPRELRPRPSRDEVDPAARELVRRYGDEVMASARRWAETPEDAEDAFQRGLEIMLTKAPSTDPNHLVPWLKTVVKREAWAIRRQRERHTPPAPEFAELDTPGVVAAHDQAEVIDRLQRGAEAMRRLKPQEVRAFVLKAEGLSYQEICEETGWTYTKVNRCLSEGRRRFADRLAGIESGAECDRLGPQLSALADGEASAADMTLLRPHLRTCLMCRARLRDYRAVPARVAALSPPVAVGGLLASARELLHTAGGWLGERSASLAVRWHQATELAAAHKVAAVAASTAVLASGGAATVVTVDGGDRPAAVRPAPDSSVVPSPPLAPRGNEGAGPHDTTASNGTATGHATLRDEGNPAERDPASAARPAGQASAPGPPAGEFTPDTAPAERAEPAAPQLEPPARAGGVELDGGGEFAP